MKIIKDKYLEFLYNEKNTPDYNIILELYRGKLYIDILNNFIMLCTSKLGYNIFNIKKSYRRTLSNILSSWMFSLYSDYDFIFDSFFPNNFNNHKDKLKIILLNFCQNNKESEEKNKKTINSIIQSLIKNFKINLSKLTKYKEEINIYYTYKISTSNFIKKDLQYIKFNIFTNINIFNNHMNNILNNIIIPINNYNKIKTKYTNNNTTNNNFNELLWILIFRYNLLSSNNYQLSLLPNIFKRLEGKINLQFESFSSALNFNLNYYCSIYYDIEKYFGSYGNFFDLIPISGVYNFNPPFQKDIIEEGINRIILYLSKAVINNKKLTFIITIPVWDFKGKKLIKNNNNNSLNFGDFVIMDKIRKSNYFKGLLIISKNDFSYFDYNNYLTKNITIQNTYLIILSNNENHKIDIVENMNFKN
jgi:hypothetical protein